MSKTREWWVKYKTKIDTENKLGFRVTVGEVVSGPTAKKAIKDACLEHHTIEILDIKRI